MCCVCVCACARLLYVHRCIRVYHVYVHTWGPYIGTCVSGLTALPCARARASFFFFFYHTTIFDSDSAVSVYGYGAIVLFEQRAAQRARASE